MGQNQGRPFFTRSSVRWQPTESKLTSTVYTVDVDVDVVVFVFVVVFVGSYGFSDFAITGVAEVAFVFLFFYCCHAVPCCFRYYCFVVVMLLSSSSSLLLLIGVV